MAEKSVGSIALVLLTLTAWAGVVANRITVERHRRRGQTEHPGRGGTGTDSGERDGLRAGG
jgi:hypothetical protein